MNVLFGILAATLRLLSVPFLAIWFVLMSLAFTFYAISLIVAGFVGWIVNGTEGADDFLYYISRSILNPNNW